MRNFVKDERAIVWAWAMLIIALILGAVIFFPLSYAWDQVYTNIVGQYTFTGDTALGITVIQIIMSYMMGFAVIFGVNWLIVQSKSEAYANG